MYIENKCCLRKRVTEGNIWTSAAMLGLYVDFWRCPCVPLVSVDQFLDCVSIPQHHQPQRSTTTSSYNQDFMHHFTSCCSFNHPSLPQHEPADKETRAHVCTSFRAPPKEHCWTHPVSSWGSAALPPSPWQWFGFFFFSTTVSAGCCPSAVSLERSWLWKTSSLMANCNQSTLALTVPLGSIHLRPCCFVKRDV